jgi:hypothetical protein
VAPLGNALVIRPRFAAKFCNTRLEIRGCCARVQQESSPPFSKKKERDPARYYCRLFGSMLRGIEAPRVRLRRLF